MSEAQSFKKNPGSLLLYVGFQYHGSALNGLQREMMEILGGSEPRVSSKYA
jgi:hypothetical protein